VTQIGFGLDLSHWENPDTLPWESFRGKVDFVIARACYGSRPDEKCAEHIRHAREIGAKVGVYCFYRPSLPVDGQAAALLAMMNQAGIGSGDIVPAVDIEADTFPKMQPVTPAWSGPTADFVGRLVTLFGDALIYQTQREWRQMGSPAWVLERPLWCAHYTSAPSPATPGGKAATIWQHRVGTFDPHGDGGSFPVGDPQLDQNRLLLPLPLIREITDADRERIAGLVALTTAESAEEALHGRDTEPPPEVA
jgi:GH25 family lysozyme M1 (1,4-beta-N-acetylmuramidase)